MKRRILVVALAVAGAITGCAIRQLVGPRVTGTCDGACKHYIDCKPNHPHADLERCEQECPDVLGDSDARVEFERLSCDDAVEFVDGRHPTTAQQ